MAVGGVGREKHYRGNVVFDDEPLLRHRDNRAGNDNEPRPKRFRGVSVIGIFRRYHLQ